MATVEQQIAVRIRTLVTGLSQVQLLAASVKDLSKPSRNSGLGRAAADASLLARNSTLAVRSVAPLFASVKDLSTAFATGQLNIKSFASELGNAARKVKPITDAARLLGPATSTLASDVRAGSVIPLPSQNKQFISLKPLVTDVGRVNDGLSATVRNVDRLTTGTNKAKDAISQLADQYIKGDSVTRKGIEGLLKSFDSVRVARFNALIGAGTKGPTGVTTIGVSSPGRAAKDADTEIKKASNSTRTLGQQFNTATSAVFRMRAAVALVGAAIAALAAAGGIFLLARGIAEVIQEGVRFNALVEEARIGLAGIIANTFEIRDANGDLVTGAQAYSAGLALAEGQMSRLRAATITTAFEFEDLLRSLTIASSAVAGTNTNLEKTVGIVVKLSRVASAINLTPSEFGTQTGQVLSGSTRVQTRLARALFPGQDATEINEQIKSFREAGTLIQELEQRALAFQFAAKDIQNTLTSLADNAQDAFKLFAGEATTEVFDQIKAALRFIIDQIVIVSDEGVKLTPTFQKIADIFNTLAGAIGRRLLDVVTSVFGVLERWVGSITASQSELIAVADAMFEIVRQVAGLIGDLLQVFGLTRVLNSSASDVANSFRTVAVLIGLIRDVLNVIRGTLIIISTGPLTLAASIFEFIANQIDRASSGMTQISRLIGPVASKLSSFFNVGLDQAGRGVSFSATREAANGVDRPTPVLGQGLFEDRGFSANPLRGSGGGEGAAAGAKRKASELRRALNQLYDALEALQIAAIEREAALERGKNELLQDINQDRFDRQIISAKEFYSEKQRLDLEDLAREKALLERKKQIAVSARNREIGANLGRKVSDQEIAELTRDARAVLGGTLDGSTITDPIRAQNLKAIIDSQKEILNINKDLDAVDVKRKQTLEETTRLLAEQARINRQTVVDIQSELADSVGDRGISERNNVSKRISDELPKLLSEFAGENVLLKTLAEDLQESGVTSFGTLISQIEVLGIEIQSLPKPLQDFIKLLERQDAVANFTQLTSEAQRLQDTLGFGIEGAFQGFELGADFGVARDTINQLTTDALPLLQQKYDELVALVTTASADGTVLFTPEEIEFVNKVGLSVDELKRKVKELQLVSANTANAEALTDRKIEDTQLQRVAGTLNEIEAEERLIQIKRGLIAVYQQELDVLLAIAETSRTREQSLQILDLQNKIGGLRNEINSTSISLRDGILGSVSNAFQGFFDSVLSGNQSILDSFRTVVAQMLVEIGKLIFQAFVLRQVMSLVQSFLGGIGGGGGGGGGPIGGLTEGIGFAEGGYTGDGPTMEPAGIVHRGEYVIPASRVRQVGLGYLNNLKTGAFLPKLRGYASGGFVGGSEGSSGGQSKGGGVRIVNLLDKGLFSDFLNSSEGEQTIVNIMSKNSQLLAR